MDKPRKRLVLACNACRLRRTKCDGQKPHCNPCRLRGLDCAYQDLPKSPADKIETELASMNLRLDYITSLLATKQQAMPLPEPPGRGANNSALGSHEDSPFRLLATSSIMHVLDLDRDYAQGLIRLERANPLIASVNGAPRLFFVSHQQVTSALVAFSERIHSYFPLLPLDFSEQYFKVLSEPLTSSCQVCLVLLVAALGCLVHDPGSETPYFEAALASLHLVLAESTLTSIQCLIFLCLYYSCLLKPCQAHDYCLIASFKIQNLFKSGLQDADPDTLELTHRAYWAVLLVESELSVQLDVAKSDIWKLDEHIPLPNCRETWRFSVPAPPSDLSPASNYSTDTPTAEKSKSFFLAEIAMRRMLHRCNSAVTQSPDNCSRYAPSIALELERQLEEWYNYLPDNIRFVKAADSLYASPNQIGPLSNFLRVQYFCCKVSIYWPAAYQVIQDGVATAQLIDHCQRFLDSYVQLMPSLILAFRDCFIYKWTLSLSFFIITMAALRVADTPCLDEVNLDHLRRCLSSAATVDLGGEEQSPSLRILKYTLRHRLQRAENQGGTDRVVENQL